ncbi:MAG: cell division protein FtsZ [bacterium]
MEQESILKFVTLDREMAPLAKLRVVGVGGGGCNALDSMMKRGLSGVEYVAINTDAQALEKSKANHKIQVGKNLTKGLGAGADPNVGRKAIEEDREKIKKVLDGSDMVFITAGMGGGTGTGGSAVVASIAKSAGALVIGIVTKPFRWEGKRRMMNAEEGIEDLRQYVDSLILIPNERLLNILDRATSAIAAFDKPNEVLYEATRGIADIITIPGIINVDFADVRSVMNSSGEALMGCGIASGDNRAVEAAHKAISSPMLEGVSIQGAKNILLNVSGSSNLTMEEVDAGNKVIYEAAGEEANVIFGLVNKEEMNEYVSYTVIATGFKSQAAASPTYTQKKRESQFETSKRSNIGGGFNFKQQAQVEVEDKKDLDIPTIFRVRGSSRTILEEEQVTNTGFRFESFDDFDTKENSKRKERLIDDEEDSIFLRKMMD